MRRLKILMTCLLGLTPAAPQAGVLDSFVDQSQLFLATSHGAPETCLEAPLIDTNIQILDPVIVRDKPDTSTLRSSHGELQGLANMTYGFNVDFTFEQVRSDQGYCVRVADMTVNAGSVAPEIWLKRTLTEGTCRYGVTMTHERQHVTNYQNHLRRFDQALQQELPLMMKGRAYYKVTSSEDMGTARARLQTEAMALIQKLHDRSYRVSQEQDFAMDSPAEYRRLSRLCP